MLICIFERELNLNIAHEILPQTQTLATFPFGDRDSSRDLHRDIFICHRQRQSVSYLQVLSRDHVAFHVRPIRLDVQHREIAEPESQRSAGS